MCQSHPGNHYSFSQRLAAGEGFLLQMCRSPVNILILTRAPSSTGFHVVLFQGCEQGAAGAWGGSDAAG